MSDMLLLLLSHYGADAVSHTLDRLLSNQHGGFHEKPRGAPRSTPESRRKITPLEMAARLEVDDSTKKLLMRLADSFQSKAFLPSIGDVRHFLEMNGEPSTGLAQRSEAFRKVLRIAERLSLLDLQKLVSSQSHSGPTELRPLSEAIKAVASQAAGADASSDEDREPHSGAVEQQVSSSGGEAARQVEAEEQSPAEPFLGDEESAGRGDDEDAALKPA